MTKVILDQSFESVQTLLKSTRSLNWKIDQITRKSGNKWVKVVEMRGN